MPTRQLILGAVALIAAIGAFLLFRGMMSRPEREETGPSIAGQQVLVLTKDVPQGAALTGDDLAWRLFPEESIGEQFVTQTERPEALTELQNAVTRRSFAAGEPVMEGSIILPDGHGFMAAQLPPGFRAFSIEIDPATAAGGYIHPNDRVDVVLTHKVDGANGNDEVKSSVILMDVRVLAIDDKVEPQASGEAPERLDPTVAVLELTQADARRLARADMMGNISLVLRGVEIETGAGPSAAADNADLEDGGGGVTIHAFGNVFGGSR